MGVPGYFSELIRKYPNIIKRHKLLIDSFYIDANCLFHPQCFLALEQNSSNLFDKMVENILGFIDHLIAFVQPVSLIYIAVDGVPPVAKLSQQRKRRFGYANSYKHKIMRRHNIPFSTWSNIVITPGTNFMHKLHLKLLDYCKHKQQTMTCKIIYSPYTVSGEGEHKILQHIKTNKCTQFAIYGLDADLIFLAMACNKDNVYLLREASAFLQGVGQKDDLVYVDINELKSSLSQDLCGTKTNKKIINDYIFICYFLGNDFLPHLPSIDIKVGGYTTLLRAYLHIQTTLNSFLLDVSDSKVTINNIFLQKLLDMLAKNEKTFFEQELPNHLAKHSQKICPETLTYKKEIWEIENLKNIKDLDIINLHFDDYLSRKSTYYQAFFQSSSPETISDVCHNYIEGLTWVTAYYFNHCENWTWQYKYTHSPFLSDVSVYLRTRDINNFIHQPSHHIDMITQLVSVFPPAFAYLLPKKLQWLITSETSPIIDMYPVSYRLDITDKTMLYTCIPILPYLDITRVRDAIRHFCPDIASLPIFAIGNVHRFETS